MCRIFYKDKEIENIKNKQEKDLFAEIRQMREEALLDQRVFGNGTRINIQEFAPKEVRNLSKDASSKRGRRRAISMMEDEEMGVEPEYAGFEESAEIVMKEFKTVEPAVPVNDFESNK